MDRLNYEKMTRTAMVRAAEGMVHDVLAFVVEHGLPSPHWFVIDFATNHPDVQLDDDLRQQYPEQMRIVLQEWFEDLAVDELGFGVTLNFGDVPSHVYVPFPAVRLFADPGVSFTFDLLQLRETMDVESQATGVSGRSDRSQSSPGKDKTGKKGKVIKLDQFRPR